MFFYQKTNNQFALYARLSSEDGDKAESCSIANQRELIHAYIKNHPEFTIVKEYTDDGYSGTNFERPGFKQMMEDAKKGIINGIIVKDLSRLGRNYIEMGRYLEQVFPVMNIRFIAINDSYDTALSNDGTDSMVIPFKNLLNDSYCRDISMKVRSQFKMKMQRGDFIGSFAPYGYKKDPKNKRHLIVDEYAAGIVRKIFNLKLDGVNSENIANRLNAEGVLSPFNYKRMNDLNYHSGFKTGEEAKWCIAQVNRILNNEYYIGTVVQGKVRKINYKVNKSVDVKKEDWIRVENMHEPIISREEFQLVQKLKDFDTCAINGTDMVEIFSGIARCADCGAPMFRRTARAKGHNYLYLRCSTFHYKQGCSSHMIRLDKLDSTVLEMLQEKIREISNLSERIDEINSGEIKNKKTIAVERQIELLDKEIKKYEDLKQGLYEDMTSGIISREEYKEFGDNFEMKIRSVKDARKEVLAQKEKIENIDFTDVPWINDFLKYKNITVLNRRIVVELIDKILIHDKNTIEIVYRFSKEMNLLLDDENTIREGAEDLCDA